MMSDKHVLHTMESLYQHYLNKQERYRDREVPNTFAEQNEIVIEALELAICKLSNAQWKDAVAEPPEHMQRVQALTSEGVIVSAVYIKKEKGVFMSGDVGAYLHEGIPVIVTHWTRYPDKPFLEEE